MSKLKNKILKNYILNKCSTKDIESLKQWLEESEDHASQLFKIEELYHLGRFRINQDTEHIEKAEQNLFKAIDNSKSTTYKSPLFLQYAAAIIIICICSYMCYLTYHSNKAFNMIEVSATAKSIKRVILPDGSNVWLNHSSILKYPQKFSKAKRNVELKGEAYFEVTKNPHQPFIVKSEAMTIEVLGTKFNFNTKHTTNNYEELSLLEGIVQVHGNNDKSRITITPGQKIILNKRTQQFTIQRVNARMESLWHESTIQFRRSNIQEIATILEHLYNKHIIIGSNINRNMTYSGEMRRYERIDSVLKALCYSMPIYYNANGKLIYLYTTNK